MLPVSALYGKKIISTTGKWVGEVQHVVIDLDEKRVSHLLTQRLDAAKTPDVLRSIFSNSVKYERVKKVSETILVSEK